MLFHDSIQLRCYLRKLPVQIQRLYPNPIRAHLIGIIGLDLLVCSRIEKHS